MAEPLLAERSGEPAGSPSLGLAGAGLAAVLGLALLQGGGGVRRAGLWVTGLTALGLCGVVPGYVALHPDQALGASVMGLGVLLAVAGAFALLTIEQPSSPRAVIAIALSLAGAVGGVLVGPGLTDRGEHRLRANIEELALPERQLTDDATGITVIVPEGWVMLSPGSALVPEELEAKVAFGETTRGAVAVVQMASGEAFFSADHFLDELLELWRSQMPGLQELSRGDARGGGEAARVATFSWTAGQRRFRGFSKAWNDGSRFLSLSGWTEASLADSLQPRFAALEAGLSFAAPMAGYFRETVARVTSACAMLSPDAVEMLARSLPRDAPVEEFFRRGYAAAMQGIASLSPADTQEVGRIMSQLFESLGESDRERLGRYLERLRAGRSTRSDQDRAMNQVLNGAIRRLTEPTQARLRLILERAIAVGRLS